MILRLLNVQLHYPKNLNGTAHSFLLLINLGSLKQFPFSPYCLSQAWPFKRSQPPHHLTTFNLLPLSWSRVNLRQLHFWRTRIWWWWWRMMMRCYTLLLWYYRWNRTNSFRQLKVILSLFLWFNSNGCSSSEETCCAYAPGALVN